MAPTEAEARERLVALLGYYKELTRIHATDAKPKLECVANLALAPQLSPP